MHGTKCDRDSRRAERWIARTGGLAPVSPEALDLLARRLAARRRASLQCLPLLLIAVAVLASVFLDGQALGTANWERTFVTRALVSYAVASVGALVMDLLARRADRGISHALSHRVSRGTAVPIRMMLGRVRTTFVVAALVAEATLSVALLSVRTGWLDWTYLAASAPRSGWWWSQ
jgi:hypothetical protein